MTVDRIRCDVPGCRASSAANAGCIGWICSRHWRLVPKAVRRRDRRVHRALADRGLILKTDRGYLLTTPRGDRMGRASWRTLVRAAIKAAAGL